jgi:hypothetical protein
MGWMANAAKAVRMTPEFVEGAADLASKNGASWNNIMRTKRSLEPVGKAIASASNKIPYYRVVVGAGLLGGAALGSVQGAKESLVRINKEAGNPVGFAADMGIKRTFSGTTTPKSNLGATGDMAYRMGRGKTP